MTVYLIVAGALALVAVLATVKARGSDRAVTANQESLTSLSQLQVGGKILIRNRLYTIQNYERLGTTSVTPAYRYLLSGGGAHSWLHVQTGPGSGMAAWHLQTSNWSDGLILEEHATEVVYEGRVYDNCVSGASTRYPLDGTQSNGSLAYRRFFLNYVRSFSNVEPPSVPTADMLSAERYGDDEFVAYYGVALDVAGIKVQF